MLVFKHVVSRPLALSSLSFLPFPPFSRHLQPTPLDILSLAFASASLIFPFGVSLTCILVQVVAPRFFKKETVGRGEWAGTFLVIAGAALSTAFGDHESRSYTGEEIMALYANPVFIGVFVAMSAVFVACMCVYHTPRLRNGGVPPIVLFLALVYIPSYLGGMQTISLKSFSEVSANSVQGKGDEWSTWPPYLFIALVISLAVLQLKYMNIGTERFEATRYFPAYNTVLMLVVVTNGAVFFQEYSSLHPVAFPIGLVLISAGIAVLTRNDPTDHAAVAAIDRLANANANANTSSLGGDFVDSKKDDRNNESGTDGNSPMAVTPSTAVAQNKYVVMPMLEHAGAATPQQAEPQWEDAVVGQVVEDDEEEVVVDQRAELL
jgi:drug/metabolite transporter (DMT)-like permease